MDCIEQSLTGHIHGAIVATTVVVIVVATIACSVQGDCRGNRRRDEHLFNRATAMTSAMYYYYYFLNPWKILIFLLLYYTVSQKGSSILLRITVILQGSVATLLRCGGQCDSQFVANFLINSRMKKFR